MTDVELWEEAVRLKDRLLGLSSGLQVPWPRDNWSRLVCVGLDQANARLRSICTILEYDENSAVILMRSMFELDVNLSYISLDRSARPDDYLQHGGVPLTPEQAETAQRELEEIRRKVSEGVLPDLVPHSPWRKLGEMCEELEKQDQGLWLATYVTFYRYASVSTHAGSFTFGKDFLKLLRAEAASLLERSGLLCIASVFHIHTAMKAADAFPEAIDRTKLLELKNDIENLFQRVLARKRELAAGRG